MADIHGRCADMIDDVIPLPKSVARRITDALEQALDAYETVRHLVHECERLEDSVAVFANDPNGEGRLDAIYETTGLLDLVGVLCVMKDELEGAASRSVDEAMRQKVRKSAEKRRLERLGMGQRSLEPLVEVPGV
jgi:hypothetical protein